MAHVTTFSTPAHTSVFASIVSAFSAAVSAFKEARAIEATYTKLSALSDRELADIGLNRGSIYEAAMGTKLK
ncbi:uncharacterized protein DUF1127 [Pacificibacter maritimus]|uniref:Uncharacterized protein DUF1127 n=1 Tax=Pacificibacter maritimus TaxID=762213 RepID=A0A3N4TXY3_9RHOB|nr:DUF1127 domain-containing protein [Pacificibacter maritimus]RPE63292.1 uncharacterized protein DUF1127 [Pacificibacter maritimus]